MEFVSQYDTTIHYLPGEQNCVADALSHLPDPALTVIATTLPHKISMRFKLEDALIKEIHEGYALDPFMHRLTHAASGMPNI